MRMLFYDDQYMDAAYEWLCRKRVNYSDHSDIWHLRNNWPEQRQILEDMLQSGDYQMSPVQCYLIDGEWRGVWSARDAQVLKMITIYLSEILAPVLSQNVYHIRSDDTKKRGVPAAIQEVTDVLPNYKYVMRSDVKGYYASIDHSVLLGLCQRYIHDPLILKIIKQYVRHHSYADGIYRTARRGISMGCPLSPILSALYLLPLDTEMDKLPVFYIRYMDDWIILAKSRWQLRRAVRRCNQILQSLKVTKHPDKTYIGKMDKGFDFFGVHYDIDSEVDTDEKAPTSNNKTHLSRYKNRKVVRSAAQTSIQKHIDTIRQLYEQGETSSRIGGYRHRWNNYMKSIGVNYPLLSSDWPRG